MFHDDGIFKRIDLDDLLSEFRRVTSSPHYCGCVVTSGHSTYENARSNPLSDTRDPVVDTVLNEKERTIKLLVEMPGIEKSDINVEIEKNVVTIDAAHDKKKYHSNVPLRVRVDERTAKASYKNGILEVALKLEEEKPTGKKIEIE